MAPSAGSLVRKALQLFFPLYVLFGSSLALRKPVCFMDSLQEKLLKGQSFSSGLSRELSQLGSYPPDCHLKKLN